MQGVMLDIVAMILIVVEENLPFGILWSPWSDLFYALMFWWDGGERGQPDSGGCLR